MMALPILTSCITRAVFVRSRIDQKHACVYKFGMLRFIHRRLQCKADTEKASLFHRKHWSSWESTAAQRPSKICNKCSYPQLSAVSSSNHSYTDLCTAWSTSLYNLINICGEQPAQLENASEVDSNIDPFPNASDNRCSYRMCNTHQRNDKNCIAECLQFDSLMCWKCGSLYVDDKYVKNKWNSNDNFKLYCSIEFPVRHLWHKQLHLFKRNWNFIGCASIRTYSTTRERRKRKVSPSGSTVTRFYSTTNQSRDGKNANIIPRLKPPWRIMFFGTDEIAEHTLKELYRNMSADGNLVESLEVVTVKEQRAVRMFAEKVGLETRNWPVAIENGKYDVGVLVSFGHLIPDAVIHMFPYGILNMHPSLLPRWRGASPVIHTILNGDEATGVSVMDIRPNHFDIGPVLLQRSFRVPHRCTSFQLADIVGQFGAHMMLECLRDLPTLERFEREQSRTGVTYAHKIKHVNANIDWESQTAFQVDCQYRAIAELMPLKTEYEGHVVKLLDVVDPDLFEGLSTEDVRGYKGDINLSSPGTVVFHKKKKCLVVKCQEGFIGFHSLVLKRKLSAADFYNGYLNRKTQSKFSSLDNELNKYIQVEKIPAQVKG